MYKKEIVLHHNEIASKINVNTGEVIPLMNRPNNIPEGRSKLDYKRFGMLNLDLSIKLEKYFSNLEIAVIYKLINRVDFNNNSLNPLNDDVSIRMLADEFNISINSVPKVFSRLKEMGVYAQLDISEDSEDRKYWILNPYLFWRGKLKDDSLFITFSKTDVAKLLV